MEDKHKDVREIVKNIESRTENDEKFFDAEQEPQQDQPSGVARLGKPATESDSKPGGDTVPHGVKLEFNGDDSYKSLVLKWNKARKDPESYEVTVYRKDKENIKSFLETFSTKSLSNIVSDLQHLTTYCCVVKCKYADERDGNPVWSNTLQTLELPPELCKVQRVWADNDPLNRVRQIIVNWEKPKKKIEIFHFEVYLIYGQKYKTEIHRVTPEKPMKACFTCLKSNTAYIACVITVSKTRRKSDKVLSDAVATDPANKVPGFIIKEQGKPIIKKCCVEQTGDELFGKFKWALPDLGIEKNNYKFLTDQPSLKEGMTVKVALNVEKGQRQVKKIKLDRKKSYLFTVTCSYLDYDSGEKCEASVTEIIYTDIGKPSIDDVKWFDKDITVSWSAAKGAKQHILKVFDKKNNLVIGPKPLKHPTINFPMTKACNYGKTCKFLIEASGEKQNETAEKSVLIGGDKAVTEVVAKQDVANPRRAIVVEWEPPKQPPQGYRLILHDLCNENKPLKEEVNPIEASRKTHRFVELKTETQYRVCVCPIYNGNTSEGTLSNVILTEKRINHLANEQESGFGQTEKIIHAVKAVSVDLATIELSWSSVQMGENYKVTGYEVLIYRKGWLTNILKKNVGPKITSVEVDLKKGLKYEVKISTLHLNLDTVKNGETSKDYEIFTDPSKTIINDCGLGNGVVFITWQSVIGANKYKLVIKDEYFIKSLVPDTICDVTAPGKGCSAKIELSGDLQIGRTCMTKVIVYAEGGGISETDWKAHLLGGNEVPRNVKATRSSENQKRAVNVTFDCPIKGPAPEYKIVASPQSGMKKILDSMTNNVVVEYLRKGIIYHFDVYAKWEKDWTKGSPSNSVCMEGDKGKSLMDIHNIKGTNVDLTNAILAGQITEMTVSLGKDFGQVEDLRTESKRVRDKDSITLHWNTPSFEKNVSDFKVEIYKVEVWKQHGNSTERRSELVDFEKNRREYQSKEFELDLGETYMFAISTIYLDIDQDYIFKSIAVPGQFHTRPCAPRCIRNDYIDDTLTIEWNAAKGAQRYQVEIYADNDSDATFRQDMEKNNTIYQRKFDETFGYGSTYYVVIKSFGVDNIPNSSQTSEKIIGGDRVAMNVTVTSNHQRVTDRNSEVFLSWTAPNRAPKRYDISSFPTAETMKTNITGEECLVSGLKAGMEYYFKVKAVQEQNGKEKLSGGSTSKRICTNPTPTQVKKVWTGPGKNPSTSVEISWEKVDAQNENETTKYRVCLTNEDETTKRELIDVEAENITLQGLEPGSKYFVTVAGANCMGYGIDSEKIQFKTDLGSPKNVHVLNNMENLSTSIILEFSNAEGRVIKYIATLHKCRNQIYQPMSGPREVKSGHIYNDLEPNTEYLVKLQAVFASGKGKVVQSRKVMTAPSKTKIIESGRTVQNEQSSSREIYAEWSSDLGCNYHEVKVIYGTSTIESRLFKENNENKLKYLCLNAATQYLVQVRSRNDSGHFGDWSDEALIYLAPAKLHQVLAELGENGHDIFVRCRAALTHSLFYFMRALCGNEPAGKPIQAQEENDIVKWKFTPPESAQRYTFELWAEDSRIIKGKRVLSNSVISRPQKFTFTMVRTILSTDIDMAWEKQERCDSYEITICARDQERPENIVRTAETSCWYRCKSPGNTYLISIRAIRELVKGEWSDHQQVTLAPGKIHLEPTEAKNEAVNTIKIEWKPLDITPEGYLINLFCNGKKVDTIETKTTNHVFEKKLKPGSLCYCTVAAFNDEGRRLIGKASKSGIYRIEWTKASYFEITADENESSQRVEMNWDKPPGVNCFKLEIENNQTEVVTTKSLTDEIYVFESGIPGNTYSVRLHCGCDDRYDVNYIQRTLTMKPKPPTDIRVDANDQVKGLIIEFKDTPSIRKRYEITAQGLTDSTPKFRKKTSQHSLKLRGLVPGESYKVSVSTIIGESRSIEATSEGYVSTFPDGVRNLRSKMGNGIIVFEWDAPEIKPIEYIVEWRVDNEPITEEHTQEPSIGIDILKQVQFYRVRVKAANSSGVGPMSHWEKFKTGVLAPPDGSQTQTKPSSSIQDKPREQSGKAYSGEQNAQTKKIKNSVHLKLIEHEDMKIWYDPDKPLRLESNVFPAKREGADGPEEYVVKFIPGITERNKREVKHLKMVMTHENIVKYYASGVCEFRSREAIYLLMEKCDHDTVWERFYSEKQLKNGMRKKPVAYTKCKFEMRSIGEGIQYIHERHIVHRDLKPHNILIRDGVLVISDFGLSKRLSNSKSSTIQSQTDIGTNGWRAPETGDDDAKTTKASDVFSFGLVSYYMLTNGKHPYGEDPQKWHTYIVDDDDDVNVSKMCLDGLDSLPDAQLSKDLIRSMLVRKLEERPTIAEVLSHPFFWDDRRKFEFISDVCKYLEFVTKLEKKPAQTEEVSLMSYLSLDGNDGKYAEKVDMTNWKEKIVLDKEELQELRNKAGVSNEQDIQEDSIQKKVNKKAEDCVSDAIKFIRNRYTHDHEDKAENIDMTNEELWEFFNKRFPYLFLFVYHKMKVYFTEKSRDDKDFTSTMARLFVR